MRKLTTTSNEPHLIPYTPDKSFIEKMVQNNSEMLNTSYINYHHQNSKRSHTPSLYKKIKTLKWSNIKQKQTSNAIDFSTNNRWETEMAVHKEQNSKIQEDSTTYIVNENLRLSLYKSSRAVTMKHLINLWNRSTPEIRQVMRLFWMLLNALKKPEYQVNNSIYKNWSYLWDYINKHNWTILAEVIAVSNKIERGLYEQDAMLDIKDQFEKIEVLENKLENSFKSIYVFVKTSIAFFTSKLNEDHNIKIKFKTKNEKQLDPRSKSKTGFHKHSKSKATNFCAQDKTESSMNNYKTVVKQNNKTRSQVVSLEKKDINSSKIKENIGEYPSQNLKFKIKSTNTFGMTSEAKENQLRQTEKRINPKRAQTNLDISFEKEPKFPDFLIDFKNKDLNDSVLVKKTHIFNVDQLPKMMTEDSQIIKQNNDLDNDCVLFDSFRKYESEHEQELKIKPEKLSFKSDFSETDSDSWGLKLELKQWEYTSNWSSAMTPRIERNCDNEDEVNIHSEIDFSQSFNKIRLSPEQVSRIKEITGQRKLEIQYRNSGNEMFGNSTPLFSQSQGKDENTITYNLNNSSLCNIEMIENVRDFK